MRRIHDDEVFVDVDVVRELVDAHFPAWAGLPISPIASEGTDHNIYRLGSDLAIRWPRRPSAIGQLAREARWLPTLASHLPLAVPEIVAVVNPNDQSIGYPQMWCPWGITRWIDGAPLGAHEADEAVAADLGHWVQALGTVRATRTPELEPRPGGRGAPLGTRDSQTRTAIDAIGDEFDATILHAIWDDARVAPPWDQPPRWVHGDLYPGNLLIKDGRIAAVIDFGCMGVGDPAVDAMVGWTAFGPDARAIFRRAGGFDDFTWRRGRGWALSWCAVYLPYYRTHDTVNIPEGVIVARRALGRIIDDYRTPWCY